MDIFISGFISPNSESQQRWHLQSSGGGGVHGKKKPEESEGEEQRVEGVVCFGRQQTLRAHLD